MATAKTDVEDNDIECSVCSELFAEPKLLPCAHVLCRHCLISWLTSNPDAQCPLCRCPIADKKDKSEEWEKVVDALPTDVAMEALAQSTRALKEDHVCGGCRQTAAVSICLHCSDMLCSSCTAAHGHLKATRHHKVEDLATMTAEKLSASQPSFCVNHSDRPSELYCPTHGAAICHLCASSEHRACPEVTLFEKRVEELRAELSAMSDMLKSAEEKLEQAILTLDQQLVEAEEKTKKSLAVIEEACDRLENCVKACRRRLKQLNEKAKKKVEISVQATKALLSDRRGRMTSNRRVVDRVKQSSPRNKLEYATITMRSRVKDVDLTVAVDSKTASMKILTVNSEELKRLEREVLFLGEERDIPASLSELNDWKFYPNKGVILTNDDQTAERFTGYTAVMVSSTPMQENTLYEVRIDEIRGKSGDYFPCGIVRSSPASISLPCTALNGWSEAIVFCGCVYKFGSWSDFSIRDRLKGLDEGTRVGLLLDYEGFLHLYINGEKSWVYACDVPAKCYVFFELNHIYAQVTALPMTSLKKP